MIPNVTVNWCQRTAKCEYCQNQIEAGTPLVTVFFWNKGQEGRKLNVKKYYHPQCWVDQALDYLRLNPYIPYNRHRSSELLPEDKQRRLKLMRDKARLDQRRRNLKSDGTERIQAETRIDLHILELMEEISKVGGIPKRWVENL